MPWRLTEDYSSSSTHSQPDSRRRWGVISKTRPIYNQYPQNRRLGGSKSRSGRFGKRKTSCPAGN